MVGDVANLIKALIIVLPNDWYVYIKYYFILQRHLNVQEQLMGLDMLIPLSPKVANSPVSKIRLLQTFSEVLLLNPSVFENISYFFAS